MIIQKEGKEVSEALKGNYEASEIIKLLHPDPSKRPKISALNNDLYEDFTPTKLIKEEIERLIPPKNNEKKLLC